LNLILTGLVFSPVSAISSLAEAMKTRDTSGHLISWMVSNCGTHSERESFVEQLQQFVAVDVYGGCGPFEVVIKWGLHIGYLSA
jgi:hypothetical protein